MSEDFDFNPKPKEDDKGVGKIRLDDKPGDAPKKEEAQKATKKKWLIGGGIAAGVVVLAAGLTAVFNTSAPPATVNTNPPPVVQVDPAPHQNQNQNQPPAVSGYVLERNSVAAKEAAIYRDAAHSYYQTDASGRRTGATGEAYLNLNGQEVQRGTDFAAHVELFDKGMVSLFVASGPYAGSRIEFTPVGTRGGSAITYTRVGQEAMANDNQTVIYRNNATANQVTQTVAMRSPAAAGNGVSVPGNAFEFEKQVREGGEYVSIYTVRGNVEEGIFSIKIFNGDTYEVNLANGQYSVNSVFLFHPNYQEEYARTGVEVDASNIPTINGRLNVAPAVRPLPAVTQQGAPRPGG